MNKDHNAQGFIEYFMNKCLELNTLLDYSKNLMKYIVALPNYIHHTLSLFNLTNLEEANVKVTHIESRGEYVQ